MKKYKILPFIAVICGIAGSILRHLQLETGFDDQGLAINGNFYSIVLVILSLLLAASFVLLMAKCKFSMAEENGISNHSDSAAFISMAFSLAGALCLIAGALISIMKYSRGLLGQLEGLIYPATLLITAFCVLVFSMSAYKGKDLGKSGTAAVLPIFFTCFWLVIYYRSNAANPVLYDYIYQLMAIIFGALAMFYHVGTLFGRSRPKRSLFCQCMCVFFCLTIQLEPMSVTYKLMYVFLMLYSLSCAFAPFKSATE